MIRIYNRFPIQTYLLFIAVLSIVGIAFLKNDPCLLLSGVDKELIHAVCANDERRVSNSLQNGANPNAMVPLNPMIVDKQYAKIYPASPLLIALDWRCRLSPGHLRIPGYCPAYPPPENVVLLGRLLKAGANVHVQNEVGCTPLMLAAWQGKTETVKLLLKYDTRRDAQDKDGDTALMLAIYGGSKNTIKALVDAGADVNTVHSKEGYTAVSLATARGEKDTVALLRAPR